MPPGEDYLEAILILKQKEKTVRPIDLARYMDYSRPSISRAVAALRAEGLLCPDTGSDLEFTEEGLKLAQRCTNATVFYGQTYGGGRGPGSGGTGRMPDRARDQRRALRS